MERRVFYGLVELLKLMTLAVGGCERMLTYGSSPGVRAASTPLERRGIMPAKFFRCPDGERILIDACLQFKGCRMNQRCASLRFLETIAFDRNWRGITASMAGDGPRQLYLKQHINYTISPQSRVFAVLGTGSHAKLHEWAPKNVLSEERLEGGTPDCLEQDEYEDGKYILYDDKTWGSYKVMKALGIVKEQKLHDILDDEGNPVRYKSGAKKGQKKKEKETIFTIKPETIDLRAQELQVNYYRTLFEDRNFPVSKMFLEVPVRDGGIAMAKSRGIDRNLYLIPIKRLPDEEVKTYYERLQEEYDTAIRRGYARKCNSWETWDGRRCEGYCEVKFACDRMGG